LNYLIQEFPGLRTTLCRITSPASTEYNCIAWAAEDTQRWWEPDYFLQYYWPPNAPRQLTLDAYIRAFETLGYNICQNVNYEPGFTKIAIFIKANGIPSHAARQLDTGRWTSKCGQNVDIEHELTALCRQHGKEGYGEVAIYMKKPKN